FSFSSILFAAPDINTTWEILRGIVSLQRGMPLSNPETVIGMMLIVFLLNMIQYYPGIRSRVKNNLVFKYAFAGIGIPVIGILLLLYGDVSGSFVYFKF
ncbi:MAG: hypothetical protein OEZ34_02045, partial [Spirochaetia bacterium]|nr:hypothetical protein [Spirochaetia bacterium]